MDNGEKTWSVQKKIKEIDCGNVALKVVSVK